MHGNPLYQDGSTQDRSNNTYIRTESWKQKNAWILVSYVGEPPRKRTWWIHRFQDKNRKPDFHQLTFDLGE